MFKGVDRLRIATNTIEENEAKAKELSEAFLQKLKIQNEKEEKIQKIKNEKE